MEVPKSDLNQTPILYIGPLRASILIWGRVRLGLGAWRLSLQASQVRLLKAASTGGSEQQHLASPNAP